MPFDFGQNPNRINALELVVGSFEDMESAFYEVLYGEHQWRQVVPEGSINTSVNPGASTASYRVRDWKGKGSFRARHDQGVPTVGQTVDKNLIPIETAGVTGVFDRDDARAVRMGYEEDLLQELPRIMRMACDNHVEGTIFYGDPELGFLSWLDYPTVDILVAPNGASGFSDWPQKTSDEIQFDINNAISTVWVDTKLRHIPDTVYLPPDRLALISSLRMSDASDKSVMDYIKVNNIFTATTGKELKLVAIRYLDGAGVAGVQRMVAEDTDPRNTKLPFSIPFDLLEPQPFGFDVHLFAEYKYGSYHKPYPKSMNYTDGI